MEKDEDNIQAYLQIKDALCLKLEPQGYLVVLEKSDDKVFGSRYVIWSNNEDALRLTWDGKEGWFVLEVTDILPLSAVTAWGDIILIPYDFRKHDINYLNKITQEIVDSLN